MHVITVTASTEREPIKWFERKTSSDPGGRFRNNENCDSFCERVARANDIVNLAERANEKSEVEPIRTPAKRRRVTPWCAALKLSATLGVGSENMGANNIVTVTYTINEKFDGQN